MAFHEVRFPTNLSYGVTGGPGYNTNIAVNDSGSEERMPRWEVAKRTYNVPYATRHPEHLHTIQQFYIARQGVAYGFRFKDWTDYATTPSGNTHIGPPGGGDPYQVTATDVDIAVADGTAVQFQLIKKYVSGDQVKIRFISKPVEGTTLVALNGTELDPADYTVDVTTGLITFTVAPSVGQLSAGCEFDVPVRFGKEIDQGIKAGLDDFGYGHIENIPMVELVGLDAGAPDSGGIVVDDAFCGAAVEVCMTADYQLAPGLARTFVFEPAGTGLSAILPNPAALPPGGPVFWLLNAGTHDILVKLHTGTTFATLTAGQVATVSLTIDGSDAKRWYMI